MFRKPSSFRSSTYCQSQMIIITLISICRDPSHVRHYSAVQMGTYRSCRSLLQSAEVERVGQQEAAGSPAAKKEQETSKSTETDPGTLLTTLHTGKLLPWRAHLLAESNLLLQHHHIEQGQGRLLPICSSPGPVCHTGESYPQSTTDQMPNNDMKLYYLRWQKPGLVSQHSGMT